MFRNLRFCTLSEAASLFNSHEDQQALAKLRTSSPFTSAKATAVLKLSNIIDTCSVEELDEFLSRSNYDFSAIDVFTNKQLKDKNVIETILKHKGIIDYRFETDLNTCLNYACKTGDLKLVKLLFRYGVDINPWTRSITPLQLAIKHKQEHIAEFLIMCDANVDFHIDEVYEKPSSELVTFFTAGESTTEKVAWNRLSRAILDFNTVLVKNLLDRKKYEVDMLTLYTAVTFADYEVFKLIWSSVSVEVINDAARLMIIVFENWLQLEDLSKFPVLLDREDVDLHLYRYGTKFIRFVNILLRTYGEGFITEEFYKLVVRFGERGLRLTSDQLEWGVLHLWGEAHGGKKLVETCLRCTLPHITDSALRMSFAVGQPEMVVPYCLQFNADTFYQFLLNAHHVIFPITLEFCARMFTITKDKKQALLHLVTKFEHDPEYAGKLFRYGELIKAIPDGVPSLVELSRETVRRHLLQKVCVTTRQFIHTLDKLPLPGMIKDILQYKIPMHQITLINKTGFEPCPRHTQLSFVIKTS